MRLKVCVRRTLIWQGEGGVVKAILNEFSLPAKCELMIRSLTWRDAHIIYLFSLQGLRTSKAATILEKFFSFL